MTKTEHPTCSPTQSKQTDLGTILIGNKSLNRVIAVL